MAQGKKPNADSGKKKLRFWRSSSSRSEGSSGMKSVEGQQTLSSNQRRPPPIKITQSLTNEIQRSSDTPLSSLEKPPRNNNIHSSSPPTTASFSAEHTQRKATSTLTPPAKAPPSIPPPIHPSTPSTLPPTPSPRRNDDTPSWQQADSDMRTKAMRRLHELAQEHSKNVSPDSIPPSSLLQSSVADDQHAQKHDDYCSNNKSSREQKIIDAVLGLHPCVAVETKEVIRGYASKPTSPMTVVNLEKMQKGGNHFFDFAKRSVGKLMNCAADLKDLHESDGLCAWEDGSHGRDSLFGRGHRQYSSDDEDDIVEHGDGDVAAVSTVDQRRDTRSPVSRRHSSSGNHHGESVGSLEEVMGTLDVNGSLSKVLLPSEHQYHTEDSSARQRIGNKTTSGGTSYLQLEVNGATSGLTSLKSLSGGGSPKQSMSVYELETANPTTSNIPFDERSDTFKPVDLYASSAFGDDEMSPRKLYKRSGEIHRNAKVSPGKSFKVEEDWSVCTDEREL